jgi:TetR/AcrR family transcriptional regulator of autoinduction and epiphytic fitness
MEAALAPEGVDGRRQRRNDNRETVLDALVDLFAQGVYEPSSNEIAERAGLSPRSLFRYFDDIDDLSRAAIERQLAAARPLLELSISPGAPLAARIEELVESRVRLFETVAPAARAARVCAHRNAVIARQLAESRAYLRRQIEHLFAAELVGERSALLPVVDAICTFESFELIRVDQGLSRAKTVSTLGAALTALLLPTGGCP